MKTKTFRANTSSFTTARCDPEPKRTWPTIVLKFALAVLILATPGLVTAQNNHAIWGELKIKSDTNSASSSSATIVLSKVGTGELARQTISNGGRYRFTNLGEGDYDIVAEIDQREVSRVRLNILPGALSPFYGFRQDFEFTWRENSGAKSKPGVVSAADAYSRSSANQVLFTKAQEAVEKKKYDEAAKFLNSILENDKADFQVWALLGTVYMVEQKPDLAEKAYLSALALKPTFNALLNLGRLRSSLKRFEEAIEPLTEALKLQPEFGEINLLLGEAYLQTKKGSKAVPHLNEAARQGRPEAHLRLGWLYNAAGMKDKAAIEYQEFLKKKPDYPDRKKLEDYISQAKGS
ncbi:MAG TPA: tetratricopeptide repeat protein [Pyrinomonadaceae bacterium]|nr:tetratricopeptide repeat protein [Pyrinomonadaceae bacterium]